MAGALLRRSGSASPVAVKFGEDLIARSTCVSRPSSGSARGRPPLLSAIVSGESAANSSATPAVQGLLNDSSWARIDPKASHQNLGLKVATPAGYVSKSPASSSRSRQKRSASADAVCAQQALEDKDAELGLLRARFNLRLDAERVRTDDTSKALRAACDESVQAQHETVVAQLASMRHRFAETTSLQQLALDAALSEERMRGVEEQSVWRAEVSSYRQGASQLQTELRSACDEAAVHAAKAVATRENSEAELSAERLGRHEDAEGLQAALSSQREVLVREVVARFEQEHFRLSATLAAEVARRKKAEEDSADVWSRLKTTQQRLNNSLLESESSAASAPVSVSRSIQTELGTYREPCSPRLLDMMAMRLADVEGERWRAADSEAERLEFVADRLRRAVALKNDTIDELKDELRRREREILEARGILAGLGEAARPCI